jgi:hypothetical protein
MQGHAVDQKGHALHRESSMLLQKQMKMSRFSWQSMISRMTSGAWIASRRKNGLTRMYAATVGGVADSANGSNALADGMGRITTKLLYSK